jgi:SpoVK/Ycf46/Vps4 family AAA+-type ATPase
MERNTSNIHLKNNELFYRIQNSEQIFKAISLYGSKISDTENNKYGIKVGERLRKHHNLEKIQFLEYLDFGKSNLLFENTNIIINIIQFDKPLINDSVSKFHSEMEVQIVNNDNTLERNKEIAKSFFKKCIEYFSQDVLDKKKESNRTTIYIWDDGYWETLEKGISRDIKTIYMDGVETKIKNTIKKFLSKEEEQKYSKFGVPYKLNMLFHGYPGTGKTSLVYSIASELDMGVALLSFTRKMEDSDFMRALRRLPDDTILVIEDIDTLFESRKKNDENKNNITFSALLNTLDGIAHSHGQIIIMTTNHPLVLDNALKRPGRVDHSYEFGYANKNQIKKMFETFIPNQVDSFPEFYKKVKNLKLTTAILQKFYFGNINCENIIEFVPELEKICNENNYDIKNNLYM